MGFIANIVFISYHFIPYLYIAANAPSIVQSNVAHHLSPFSKSAVFYSPFPQIECVFPSMHLSLSGTRRSHMARDLVYTEDARAHECACSLKNCFTHKALWTDDLSCGRIHESFFHKYGIVISAG